MAFAAKFSLVITQPLKTALFILFKKPHSSDGKTSYWSDVMDSEQTMKTNVKPSYDDPFSEPDLKCSMTLLFQRKCINFRFNSPIFDFLLATVLYGLPIRQKKPKT